MLRALCRSARRQCRLSSSDAPNKVLPHPRLDYRNIAENIVYKTTNAQNRKAPIPHDAIQSVARAYTEFKTISSALNSQRNARSVVGERIRQSAKANDAAAKEVAMAEALGIKEEISRLEAALASVEETLLSLALAVPNDTHPSSPLGPESAAVELSTHGPAPIPATTSRDHVAIGKQLGLLDLDSGATVAGNSWYYLTNEGALLEMALVNYALSVAIRHGFKPVLTPDVVRSEIARSCGFQPRDTSELSQEYHLSGTSQDLVLCATAEIPLAGMFANKIYQDSELPAKVVGIGHAFRSEAGARGKDTHGLYRVHQFTKVELFAVTTQEQSEKMMEDMQNLQISILSGLGLAFRVLDMPTEELGASAYRKYDMEAWMPGRGSWGEVSSLSNCTDFQARRLHVRYRGPVQPNHPSLTTFAHTLNGTAAAIPRLIVALLENGAVFDEEGKLTGIRLPDVLRPFWIGSNEGGFVHWH
ncbi:AA-TRNA-LIGASE-II domain-containing protein [Mycena indigotica]|uniref:serine--tRNA ligase n=1 Tax=Mycena indigotica TaxID=2126181 RepID=A0A8H6SX97_9AGAR|nr:AA-TRNA-LIGASE-II domain-containing protein [Mycena indigotica]KAF7307116.1 AA-TRNA-LIGASE-II domain-containing protein [Mycena indigotica]